MPITAFQKGVLRLLASNRSPDSFVAGAIVVNQASDSPRYSKDIDINHDIEEAVMQSADKDVQVLMANGYTVHWKMRQPMFARAIVERDGEQVKLEWVFDSAFRFFPAERDPDCGWRLNFYDAATNKVLALVGRIKPRDFVDVVHIHQQHLSFGALCWAASAKDVGMNPFFILEEAKRTTHYTAADFGSVEMVQPLNLSTLYEVWRKALAEAETLISRLPPEEAGCLYLDKENHPVTPAPGSPEFPKLIRHFGSVRGAWPVVRE